MVFPQCAGKKVFKLGLPSIWLWFSYNASKCSCLHLQHVILKVKASLEGLVTMRAGKRPDVVVDRVDVSRQSALLREVLSTELTADLATDAVGAKVVTKRIPVRVTFLADVADQLLSLDGRVK